MFLGQESRTVSSRITKLAPVFTCSLNFQIVNEEVLKKMEDQFEVLEEFVGHRIDENLIKHLKEHH